MNFVLLGSGAMSLLVAARLLLWPARGAAAPAPIAVPERKPAPGSRSASPRPVDEETARLERELLASFSKFRGWEDSAGRRQEVTAGEARRPAARGGSPVARPSQPRVARTTPGGLR